MSIRLDPRRVGALKQLAGEAGVRPGDLVRQWVEERIDAERQGIAGSSAAADVASRIAGLEERIAALEAAVGVTTSAASDQASDDVPAGGQLSTGLDGTADAFADEVAADPPESEPAGYAEQPPAADQVTDEPAPARRRRSNRVAAAPAERVALHDEMIAVLAERGPLSAADLATAIAERGRYAPPRSGKPIGAATVSQRASNPTYRARFVRADGRIGLAGQAAE